MWTDDYEPEDFKDFDHGIKIGLSIHAKDGNMAGGMVVESDNAIVVGFPNFDRNQATVRGEGNILKITDKTFGPVTSPSNKKFHQLRKSLGYPPAGEGKSRTPYLGMSVASGIDVLENYEIANISIYFFFLVMVFRNV